MAMHGEAVLRVAGRGMRASSAPDAGFRGDCNDERRNSFGRAWRSGLRRGRAGLRRGLGFGLYGPRGYREGSEGLPRLFCAARRENSQSSCVRARRVFWGLELRATPVEERGESALARRTSCSCRVNWTCDDFPRGMHALCGANVAYSGDRVVACARCDRIKR